MPLASFPLASSPSLHFSQSDYCAGGSSRLATQPFEKCRLDPRTDVPITGSFD
jgi:hypothetical protein